MTIDSGENLKGVQEILLPGDVVALNVYYWKAAFVDPQTEADVVEQMENAMEAVYGELLPQIVSGAVLGDLAGYVRAGLLWDLIGTASPAATFAATGDMLPQGVAALMRGYTENPRTIGRKYIPGFDEATMTDGVLTAGALTDLAAAAAEWGTARVISSGNTMNAGVWSTVGATVRVFNGTFVIPTIPGYQRRRRPGVGI